MKPLSLACPLVIVSFFSLSFAFSQQSYKDCSAWLSNDTLVVQNSKISYSMLWNGGDFIPYSIVDRNGDKRVVFQANEPGFEATGAPFNTNSTFHIAAVEQNIHSPAHLRVEVENEHDAGVKVLRVFKVFPETSAITMEIYLKYGDLGKGKDPNEQKLDGTESFFTHNTQGKEPYLQQFGLNYPHWDFTVVRFKDVTDANDNLVHEQQLLPYGAAQQLQGNLLLARDVIHGSEFFLLKEGPNGESQINYPGYDYALSKSKIGIPFSGFPPPRREWNG